MNDEIFPAPAHVSKNRFLSLLPFLFAGLGWWLFPHLGNALRWPLRILVAASLVACVRQLWRWSAQADILGRFFARVSTRLEWPAPWRQRWEMLLAACVIGIAGWHFGLEMHSMAGASLIGDEIGTIRLYSSAGPLRVLSDYTLAKNHVFFNLLNSLLPGNDSLDPLRARLLSFLAVGGAWLLLVGVGWRRKYYLETALAAGLIGINHRLLDVSLEARGYGFVFGLTLLGCLALLEYLHAGRYLWVLGLTIALAVYTVPSALIFGGTLLILLFLTTRRLEVFRWGLLTAAIIATLYLPIFRQVLAVAGKYEDDYGVSYRQMASVLTTLRYAITPELWEGNETGFFLILALLAAAPVMGDWGDRPVWKATQIFLASSAVFVSFCLFLQTPPVRVTAFLAAPLVLALALVASLIYRAPGSKWLQPWLALAVLGGISATGAQLVRKYDFQPRSKWQEVAQLALNLTPPDGRVWIEGELSDLRSYTGQRLKLGTGEIPKGELAASRLLIITNRRSKEIEPLVQRPGWRCLTIGNRKTTFRRIWFPQPPSPVSPVIRFPGSDSSTLLDHDLATGLALAVNEKNEIEYDPAGTVGKSLNLWSREPWGEVEIRVEILDHDQSWSPLPPSRILVEDKIISIDLQGFTGRKVRCFLTPKGRPMKLVEVFAVGSMPSPERP